MRCVAIKNPAYRGELAVADSVVERLDAADVSRLLA
jgi:hypothetical protein